MKIILLVAFLIAVCMSMRVQTYAKLQGVEETCTEVCAKGKEAYPDSPHFGEGCVDECVSEAPDIPEDQLPTADELMAAIAQASPEQLAALDEAVEASA